jgi:hypothetical protein
MKKFLKLLNREQIKGILRHLLTFIGGYMVINGYISEEISHDIVGWVMASIGVVWSYIDKIKKFNESKEYEDSIDI